MYKVEKKNSINTTKLGAQRETARNRKESFCNTTDKMLDARGMPQHEARFQTRPAKHCPLEERLWKQPTAVLSWRKDAIAEVRANPGNREHCPPQVR